MKISWHLGEFPLPTQSFFLVLFDPPLVNSQHSSGTQTKLGNQPYNPNVIHNRHFEERDYEVLVGNRSFSDRLSKWSYQGGVVCSHGGGDETANGVARNYHRPANYLHNEVPACEVGKRAHACEHEALKINNHARISKSGLGA
eukprot:1157654-Pelagomonas_calceolata.AAC.6